MNNTPTFYALARIRASHGIRILYYRGIHTNST